MRYGHEAGGLVGLTLQPSAVATWALSLHVCSQLRMDVTALKEGQKSSVATSHKEEGKSRIKSDATDREKLRTTLSTFIHPLHPSSHPVGLVNIANGLISSNNVNVDSSLEIGKQQMKDFEAGWPTSFHGPLKKNVKTMTSNKKLIKIDGTPVINTEMIYTRVIGLQQSRSLNMKDVLSYELSAVPSALFDENGDLRSQAKATLLTKLQVEVSSRHISPPDAYIIDGCALLWTVRWPSNGTVEDYVKNFLGSLRYYLQMCRVHLIFDRYIPNSTKGASRSNRAGTNASRKHSLTLHTPLPAQNVVLTVTYNKAQLITLITKYLVDHVEDNTNELIITAEHPVPISITNGQARTQTNLRNTHEEADVIIVNQLVYLATKGASSISVVSDDTDVFVLLLYFYCKEKLTCEVFMQSCIAGRRIVDIKATATKHSNIAEFLPGVHALSGCDTTSFLYGIGKATALKVLNGGKTLKLLGKQDAGMEDVVTEATVFMATCYGSKCCQNMSETRHDVWISKMANQKLSVAPKLKSLPPTSEAFMQHVYRAHYQTLVWKSSLVSEPEAPDPLKYGWTKRNDKLFPVMLPENKSPVPTEILQMIKCACSSMRACSSSRCSCAGVQMSCSMFCACHAGADCNNVNNTRSTLSHEEEDELLSDCDLHNI